MNCYIMLFFFRVVGPCYLPLHYKGCRGLLLTSVFSGQLVFDTKLVFSGHWGFCYLLLHSKGSVDWLSMYVFSEKYGFVTYLCAIRAVWVC